MAVATAEPWAPAASLRPAAVRVVAGASPLRWLLCAYAAVVPFGSGITLPVPLPPPFDTLTTLLGLVAAAGIAIALVRPERRGAITPMLPLALLFLGASGTTYAWSVDKPATVDALLVLGSLVGLYAVVLLARHDAVDADRLGDAIAIGGALACVYGLYLLVSGGLPPDPDGLPARFATAGGVESDPNITAAALVLPLVLAWDRVLGSARARRLAWTGAGVVIAVGILLTASRGGVLGAAAAVVVLLAVRRRLAVALAAVAIGLGGAFVTGLVLAPGQLDRLLEPGSSGRTSVWRLGVLSCEQRCGWGSGLGTYLSIHEENYLSYPGAQGFRASLKAHNIWLQTGVETGVLGVVLLLGLFLVAARALWHVDRVRRAAPLAGVVGLLVTNTFVGNVSFKYFWLVLVYAAVVATAVTGDRPTPQLVAVRPFRWRTAGAVGAVAGVVAFVLSGVVGASPARQASALVVIADPTADDDIDLDPLARAVFDAAGLDAVATLHAPEGAVGFEVTAERSDASDAARAATTAALALVRDYNRAGPASGRLVLADRAHPEAATTTGGELPTPFRMGGAALLGLVAATVAGKGVRITR